MIYMIIAVVGFGVTLIGAIVKSIWFKVPLGHVAVIERNERLKLNKYGEPIVKDAGWRCQVPVRDDARIVDCTIQTTELEQQKLRSIEGKQEIKLSIQWHRLSSFDGEQYRTYPTRSVRVENLEKLVSKLCEDVARYIIANSKKPASQWESSKLYKKMQQNLGDRLDQYGVKLDDVQISDAAPSEAQTQGLLILEGFKLLADSSYQAYSPPEERQPEPELRSVPN